jgi:hypothetical protein
MRLCRILLVLGVVLGIPSVWETLAFSWDPTFQAPALRYGPTHTNYHAFREFTLTLGSLAVMLWAMFQPPANRTHPLWVAMAFAAVCYYGGWWLPWPLLGLHTPSLAAELVHLAAALASGSAIVLSGSRFSLGDR